MRNKLLLIAMLVIIFSSYVYAISLSSFNGLFYDGFESGNFSTNNWTRYGTGNNWTLSNNSANAFNGSIYAEVNNVGGIAYLELNISTQDYKNITFSFYRQTIGLDNGENFTVYYYNGTVYKLLENDVTNSPYTLKSYNISSDANNNSKFTIRFQCNNNAPSERCRVDDIRIQGIYVDIIPPSFSNNTENPVNPAAYQENQTYSFNTTVMDNIAISSVIIEFNNINYTATNISNIYSFNLSNLATGTYNYRWIANDTSNNYNATNILSYAINQANSSLQLLLNSTESNITINANNSINITGYLLNGSGNISLYINNSLTSIGPSPLQNITSFESSGIYEIKLNYSGNQNYTASEKILFINVTLPSNGSSSQGGSPGSSTSSSSSGGAPVGDSGFNLPPGGTIIRAQPQPPQQRPSAPSSAPAPEQPSQGIKTLTEEPSPPRITGSAVGGLTGAFTKIKEAKKGLLWLLLIIICLLLGNRTLKSIKRQEKKESIKINKDVGDIKLYREKPKVIEKKWVKKVEFTLEDFKHYFPETLKDIGKLITKGINIKPIEKTIIIKPKEEKIIKDTITILDEINKKESGLIVKDVIQKEDKKPKYILGFEVKGKEPKSIIEKPIINPNRKINKPNNIKEDMIKKMRDIYGL